MALAVTYLPRADDDDAIAKFSAGAAGWRIEFNEQGTMLVSPTYSESGPRDVEAALQLRAFADRFGGKVFGSSAGFRLPDGSLRSPDAAWISHERLDRLTSADRVKFWRVCPDVVIEILSATDDWAELLTKLESYRKNGSRFAVALDPYARRVETHGRAPDGLELDVEAILDA